MTFLQLCQRLRQECQIAGSGPAAVTGQTGELKQLVDWVADAWLDIQHSQPDWQFLRGSVSFATVQAQATYTPVQAGLTAGTFNRWARDSFRSYDTAAGFGSEFWLSWMAYERWRDLYQFGAMRTVYTRPYRVTMTPEKSLGLGPIPTSGYTIVGDYYKNPVTLAADSDVPALPDGHNHLMIVYRAMMYYGHSEGAPEVYERGEAQYAPLYQTLLNDQLPAICPAGALA